MIKKWIKYGLLCSTALITFDAFAALTPKPVKAGSQDFVFIENNVDKEYFLAPYKVDPRFSGANVWTRYGKYKGGTQDSLGYMGTNQTLTRGNYADIWMENGTFFRPYQGIRCRTHSSYECPSTGFVPAELVNNQGAFKMLVPGGSRDYNGGYARGSLASGAYEYFKNMSVNSTEDIYMHVCETAENYSPFSGGRCKDANKGNYWVYGFNLTKMGHLTFLDTKAFQEIWYGTDGTPYISPNAQYCQYTVVNRQNGIACKMLKYNAKGDISKYDTSYQLSLIPDVDELKFTPAAADLLIEGGNGAWKNHTALTQIKTMIVNGESYISMFFSQAFFQKLAAAKVNLRNTESLFTFALRNSGLSQSGFYQFSVSTEIELIPREYSVSIQPKGLPEGTTPVKTGKIGDTKPITFEYVVKQSAPRMSDTIEAYVNAQSVRKDNESYCLFSSDDKKTNVLIPAVLSMKNIANQDVTAYSGCDINKRLNMRNAMWQVEPWDSFNNGFFFTTDLKLLFPMNHEVSGISMEGQDWIGKVRAEGEIKVVAKWLGVTFP
ncbi:hypothetical protein [Acinetobacter rudis]|uniref:Fimbrial protein n=1 Tax=Acinetobacter rudis TaxID=632955 RepID=A0AAW8J9D0_9GAMM|nr:hypothetical protein [Acinetobacter rudis]MDQ8936409.1 hypothetical protein [Acinetobacter rudis]MDQ8952887.1 hypothetical protein [Acinetobacter rudis]MDQ9018640.1 hypothetical protein [Acinetobacter rudis]